MVVKAEVNIRTVASHAGVSTAAVSRVLNKRPNVSEAMRAKVTAACAELGYTLNYSIQDLILKSRNGATRNIAYVIVGREISSPAYARSLDGVAKAGESLNYNLSLARLSGDEAGIYDLPPVLRDGRVDGILLTGALNGGIVSLLRECGRPVVVLGAYSDAVCGELPRVSLDIGASVFRMVKELKDAGRRRIAFLNDQMETFSSQRALDSFRQALPACGLEFDERLVLSGDGVDEGGLGSLSKCLPGVALPFDGVVCMNYSCAIAVSHLIFARRQAGGHDATVATLWPLPVFPLQAPALYFDLMFEAAALRGTGLLVDILSGKDSSQAQRIELAATLLKRTDLLT